MIAFNEKLLRQGCSQLGVLTATTGVVTSVLQSQARAGGIVLFVLGLTIYLLSATSLRQKNNPQAMNNVN